MAVLVNAWNISASVVNGMFSNNNTVVNINCNTTDWVNNSAVGAFSNCTNLYSVIKLSNSITNMSSAFDNCPSFNAIDYIPRNTTDLSNTFRNCSTIRSIPSIPNSVTNMFHIFHGCTHLNFIGTIPNSVTTLEGAFGYTATTNPPVIPNSVKTLASAFSGSKLITGANIPNSVTNLYHTYYACTRLTNGGTIPNSITTLDGTWYGCSNLVTAPALPNSVVNMPDTFLNCQKLANVTIPPKVTNLYRCFANCNALTTIPILPDTTTDINQTFTKCFNLISAPTIPQSVTNMYSTFRQCQNLQGDIIVLSKNVTNLVDCFYGSDGYDKYVYFSYNYTNNTRTATYNAFMTAGYTETGTVNRVFLRDMDVATLIVDTTPRNATVTLTATGYVQSGKKITVKKGTHVYWQVECDGYFPMSGDLVLNNDTRLTVNLEKDSFVYNLITELGDNLIAENTDNLTSEDFPKPGPTT